MGVGGCGHTISRFEGFWSIWFCDFRDGLSPRQQARGLHTNDYWDVRDDDLAVCQWPRDLSVNKRAYNACTPSKSRESMIKESVTRGQVNCGSEQEKKSPWRADVAGLVRIDWRTCQKCIKFVGRKIELVPTKLGSPETCPEEPQFRTCASRLPGHWLVKTGPKPLRPLTSQGS